MPKSCCRLQVHATDRHPICKQTSSSALKRRWIRQDAGDRAAFRTTGNSVAYLVAPPPDARRGNEYNKWYIKHKVKCTQSISHWKVETPRKVNLLFVVFFVILFRSHLSSMQIELCHTPCTPLVASSLLGPTRFELWQMDGCTQTFSSFAHLYLNPFYGDWSKSELVDDGDHMSHTILFIG